MHELSSDSAAQNLGRGAAIYFSLSFVIMNCVAYMLDKCRL